MGPSIQIHCQKRSQSVQVLIVPGPYPYPWDSVPNVRTSVRPYETAPHMLISTTVENAKVHGSCAEARPLRDITNYGLPKINGQVLNTTNLSWLPGPNGSLSVRYSQAEWELIPAFMVVPLSWESTAPFNFTDGSSIPAVVLITFIRTSTRLVDLGAILAADLCAFKLLRSQT